ncbi:MAG: LysR family transcriptional regulator [Microbacterium sp.]|uniref:LysR family transcriptional regulator n=1 Tax=Microbacterium sp. TaxID=51671 RepID=UPI00261758FC|nr:LysR family transcriptional regulator [Microbacterium sp.]MCX6503426.1 LysR family transcriptional regulator [Microbacterium sp.]
MSIEIRHLRQFLAVAEELHFTRAAERLHLAQPALSAQIKKLEQELQIRLFERNTRAVELTPAGEELAAQARLVVESYDSTLATAAKLRGGGAGNVSVGVSSRFRPALRRSILSQLATVAPGLTLDIVSESSVRLVQAVADGRIDAAVVVAPANIATLRALRVRDTHMVATLPETHPLSSAESVTLWELRDERWILPSSDVYASNSLMHAMCVEAGFRLKVAATASSNYDDDFVGVSEGHGIEVVPDVFTRPGAIPGVTFVPVDGPTLPIYLIARAENDSRLLGPVFKAVAATMGEEGPVLAVA